MKRNHHPRPPLSARATAGTKRWRGYTLVEVMIAISLLAIMATIGLPALGNLIDARLCENIARKAGADALFARSEAVKRNQTVLMCPGIAGTCVASPASTDWAAGWRVCYDADANGQCDSPSLADPNPLRVQSAWGGRAKVRGPTVQLRFNADGSLSVNGIDVFTVTNVAGTWPGWTVRLAASGSVSVRREAS
jgi:type IV fimbrial biogenesis protein FimT